jgi:hypothetical protein
MTPWGNLSPGAVKKMQQSMTPSDRKRMGQEFNLPRARGTGLDGAPVPTRRQKWERGQMQPEQMQTGKDLRSPGAYTKKKSLGIMAPENVKTKQFKVKAKGKAAKKKVKTVLG